MKTRTASDALEVELRALCLQEFPFGTGSWQMNPDQPLAKMTYSTTTTDYDSEKDHIESLQELVNSSKSPWFAESNWSDELPYLRQMAITNPQKVNNTFVKKSFKTLRLIDKQITELDDSLLQLDNLEELSLSANHLTNIHSANLPSKLKVLELNANLISDIGSLIKSPPPLQHLGLGKNLLEDVSSHISVSYWPHLMSLDLSENNLKDLLLLSQNLKGLPKLRNLLLNGNPVSLMPSYRGFLIDMLGNLSSLDDIIISADERHDFKAMSKKPELLNNESRLTLRIPFVRGIPNVAEADELEKNGSEYPVIERKYFVRFPFISNVERRLLKSSEMAPQDNEKDNKKAAAAGKGKAKSPVDKSPEEREAERLEQERLAEIERQRLSGPPLIVPFSTSSLEFEPVHALLQLKNLIKQGIKVEIVEEKTLFYPIGQTPEDIAAAEKEKERLNSGKDRGATPMKSSNQIMPQPPKTNNSKKSFTANAGAASDLVKYSTSENCIGSGIFDVSVLLNSTNETKVKSVLHVGGGPIRPEDMEMLETPPATAMGDQKKDKNKKKPKPAATKDKKKGAEEEPSGDTLPPPMLVLVELEIRRWINTRHFIKEHDQWS